MTLSNIIFKSWNLFIWEKKEWECLTMIKRVIINRLCISKDELNFEKVVFLQCCILMKVFLWTFWYELINISKNSQFFLYFTLITDLWSPVLIQCCNTYNKLTADLRFFIQWVNTVNSLSNNVIVRVLIFSDYVAL